MTHGATTLPADTRSGPSTVAPGATESPPADIASTAGAVSAAHSASAPPAECGAPTLEECGPWFAVAMTCLGTVFVLAVASVLHALLATFA